MRVSELIQMLRMFKPDMYISVGYDQYSKANGRNLTLKPAENMTNVLEIRGYVHPQEYMDDKTAIKIVSTFAKTIDPKNKNYALPKEVVIARDLLGSEVFKIIMEEEQNSNK